jgi:hypothetical protein
MTDAEKLAELESAMQSGVASISVDGKTISYRSLAEMALALDMLKRKTRTVISMAVNPYFDRGL